jgi:hypothetical protein
MIASENYGQLAERCTQLAIACSTPSLAGALTRLASDYVAQSHKIIQPSPAEQQLQLDPFGFGD